MTNVQQAVAKRDNSPAALIMDYRDDFAAVLPTHVKAETWVRLATGLLRRDKALAALAIKNPGSLMQALLECARLGHEPGTKSFYLVPMGNEIEGWESYVGLIDRMYRAGGITSVKVEIVRANDHFNYDPGMARPDHRPDWFSDRGEILGAYAYADLTTGGTSRVVVINRAYIDKVKAMSRGSSNPSSPWQKWEEAMVLKTAIKRLEAFVPTSTEFRDRALHPVTAPTLPAKFGTAEPEGMVDRSTGEIFDNEVVDAVLEEPDDRTWPTVAKAGGA